MRGRGGAIGLVLVFGALALANPAAESATGDPDRVDVEVAGAVEETPTVDLALNVLGATLNAQEAETAPNATPSPPTSTAPPTTIVGPSTTDVSASASTTSDRPATTTTTTSSAPLSREGQALQAMRYDWEAQFPDLQIDFLGPRNGLRALTYPGEHRIEIFVRDSDTGESLHRVLAHELGHVIDVELNSPEDRDRWLAQRRLDPATTWWPNESAPDFATGAGDFAEAFAVWETGVQSQSTLAPQPTAADLELIRELSS